MGQPSINPTATHLQVATDSAFAHIVNKDSDTYRTSERFEKGALPIGQTLYARVKHSSKETGDSAWSETVNFTIESPHRIIGVALDNPSSGGVGTFYWIDETGNHVSSFDFHTFPTYQGMKTVTLDEDRSPCVMLSIPKFYIKTAASGPYGTFADGKKCWWISSGPAPGFRPHSCFKRSTQKSGSKYIISDQIYIGTFLAHDDSYGSIGTLGSKRGQTVRNYITLNDAKNLINKRNGSSSGQTGWRLYDIYDHSAIQILTLIAKADADVQSVWGDNSSGTSYPKTGSTKARVLFKGSDSSPEASYEDGWRCYVTWLDLFNHSAGVPKFTSPMDRTSVLSFGSQSSSRYTSPANNTYYYVRDVLDCPFTIGDDQHDLMEFFFNKTTNTSPSNGTFGSDHQYWTSSSGDYIAYSSGVWSDGAVAGLFRLYCYSYSASSSSGNYIGVRVAKN